MILIEIFRTMWGHWYALVPAVLALGAGVQD